MSRRDARETALKLVYQHLINEVDFDESNTMKLAMFRDDKKGVEITKNDEKYIKEIVLGIEGIKNELDIIIEKLAVGWRLKRIPLMDLSIMRLAIYEMKFREDIPVKVSINESIELAKRYCGDTSAASINGILGNFARQELSEERLNS